MSINGNRIRIQLTNKDELLNFVQSLSNCEDAFSIESSSGQQRVNAKSVIGVVYTMLGFPEEMYLVNDTHTGEMPDFVEQYCIV